MKKIDEAKIILAVLGLPIAQQNEISALTLLALCGLKEEDNWANATRVSLGISKDIMSFVNTNYKKGMPYAPNTRETFRRQVLHQFVQARIADYNPDDPTLPVNSPNAHYKLTEEAYDAVKSYDTPEWETKSKSFIDSMGCLIDKYEKNRELNMIPVTIDNVEFKLSPGKHNEVQASVIDDFAPRFAAGAKILYMGDTADKNLYCNKEILERIGIPITEHSKLPDIVFYDSNKEWLFLIEVVTSHGPISPKRVIELEDFLKECKAGKVYVTAFPDRAEFKKHVADIAWETEVWIAENPDHMIHFNGDRFIGPR